MVKFGRARTLISHQCVESTFGVGTLRLLIDDFALLRDCIDFNPASSWCDGLRDCLAIARFPCFAIVFGIREVKVVVCTRIRSLAYCPGNIEFTVL